MRKVYDCAKKGKNLKLRGVTTKLNIIFFHHANFQRIKYKNILLHLVMLV